MAAMDFNVLLEEKEKKRGGGTSVFPCVVEDQRLVGKIRASSPDVWIVQGGPGHLELSGASTENGGAEGIIVNGLEGVNVRRAVGHGIVFVGAKLATLLSLVLETFLFGSVGITDLKRKLFLTDGLAMILLDDPITFVPRGKSGEREKKKKVEVNESSSVGGGKCG